MVLFPKEIAIHFEISDIIESEDDIIICMQELKELIPDALVKAKNIVLDGFCNPIELQSFPLKGKSVYLKLYRRRWKMSGEKEHYSNSYNIHPEGVKATTEFAFFLKGAFGQTPDQYNDRRRSFMR